MPYHTKINYLSITCNEQTKISDIYGYICKKYGKGIADRYNARIINMKATVKIFVAAVAAVVVACGLLAWSDRCARTIEPLDAATMERADSVIRRGIAEGEFPGAVLCVVRRAEDGRSAGDILYLKAYGNRQVCSGMDPASGEPVGDTVAMTTDAVFDLASLSKCVGTTLAFMRLVENGQVRLTDNVSRYIPHFEPWRSRPEKAKGKAAKRAEVPITIEQLLTHTSGLPAGIHVPTFLAQYDKYGDASKLNLRDSLVTYLARDAARLSRPGDEFRYSDLNFIVLQAIIERVAGERLDHYAAREIFAPLRLKNTWYNALDDAEPAFGEGIPLVPTTLTDGKPLCGEVHDPTARIVNRGVSGNAGLFSTAEDLAVIASMLMNGGAIEFRRDGLRGRLGETERVRVLSRRVVEKFFSIPSGAERFGRALGWDVESPYASCGGDLFTHGRTVSHTGYTGTSMVMDTEEGVAVILLTNRVHPYDRSTVARTRALVSNIVASALN